MFICRGKEDALVTKNMAVGESVYGEKRMSVEVNPLLSESISSLVQDTLSPQLQCWSGPESVLVDDCLFSTVTGPHNPYLQLVCRRQAYKSICFMKGASVLALVFHSFCDLLDKNTRLSCLPF